MYDYNYSLAAEVGYKVSTASRQNNSGLVPCYSRDFNRSQYQSTVTTEWDLVCERRALYSTTQAAVEIGKLIGFFLTGYLSDMNCKVEYLFLCPASLNQGFDVAPVVWGCSKELVGQGLHCRYTGC
ncbi:hypothetical protein O3P69_002369 [Scylla paramamosain]|uniref:Uncharacterized protein n=1 Tax=Scylla paramamosain TaxID=85552 RepID=A0AAW0V608_SCYPA